MNERATYHEQCGSVDNLRARVWEDAPAGLWRWCVEHRIDGSDLWAPCLGRRGLGGSAETKRQAERASRDALELWTGGRGNAGSRNRPGPIVPWPLLGVAWFAWMVLVIATVVESVWIAALIGAGCGLVARAIVTSGRERPAARVMRDGACEAAAGGHM